MLNERMPMCMKMVCITGPFSHTCTLGGFLKDYAQPSQPAGSFSHAARVVEKSATVPYQGLPLTIDYGLQTSNGNGYQVRNIACATLDIALLALILCPCEKRWCLGKASKNGAVRRSTDRSSHWRQEVRFGRPGLTRVCRWH